MAPTPSAATIITVSLNPAVDRIIEVENFAVGAHQVGRELSRVPAGKAINVSRVLAALDVHSVATGFLGAENRVLFDSLFRDARIVDQFFSLPGRTRENVTITDRRTGQETHIRDVGLEIHSPHLDRLRKKLHLLAQPGRIMIFSGSLPPGVSAADFADLVQGCVAAGARVAVDTSGEALRAVADKHLWLLKPNAAELAQLTGRELGTVDEQLAAARELASRVQVVLFTRGGEGACLLTSEQILHGHAPLESGQVRNTVGCGDVLLGAFVAGVWRGQPYRQAFCEAIACATASACCLGTAQFEPELMNELLAKVQLKEL